MKCSDIEKQLELFIPKGLAQTDKKEENATSEEGQDTTTSMEQHSEEESNSENPGIQGQENPTVGQETTLRPSPAQG